MTITQFIEQLELIRGAYEEELSVCIPDELGYQFDAALSVKQDADGKPYVEVS